MPGFYWPDEGVRLKSFASASRGQKATLKLEIEIADLHELGFLLRQLADIEAEQAEQKRTAATAARPRKRPHARKPDQLEHKPLLGLPYHGSD